jgi:hypothetical protein
LLNFFIGLNQFFFKLFHLLCHTADLTTHQQGYIMNFFSLKALRVCMAITFAPFLCSATECQDVQITYVKLMAARTAADDIMSPDLQLQNKKHNCNKHKHNKSHNHHHHHHHREFKRFEESVTVSMTMTIPALSGPVPVGGNFDVTPFAIAPNGKVFRGASTNIVPSSALIVPLNSVVIPHPIKGNYVVGYFLTLGAGSPVFSTTTLANCSGVILNNPVGSFTETITFPVQTLFLGASTSPTDVLTVSANFPIIHF